jgi:hypothetical protein
MSFTGNGSRSPIDRRPSRESLVDGAGGRNIMRTEIRILLAAVLPLAATPAPAATAEFTPHAFVASNGTKIDAEKGEIRARKPREAGLQSTAKEPEIPSSTSRAPGRLRHRRREGLTASLFPALLELGDVIVRPAGTGASEPDLRVRTPPGTA